MAVGALSSAVGGRRPKPDVTVARVPLNVAVSSWEAGWEAFGVVVVLGSDSMALRTRCGCTFGASEGRASALPPSDALDRPIATAEVANDDWHTPAGPSDHGRRKASTSVWRGAGSALKALAAVAVTVALGVTAWPSGTVAGHILIIVAIDPAGDCTASERKPRHRRRETDAIVLGEVILKPVQHTSSRIPRRAVVRGACTRSRGAGSVMQRRTPSR